MLTMSRSDSPGVVVCDVIAPYGVAIRGRDACIPTCSVCPSGGEVWRVSL